MQKLILGLLLATLRLPAQEKPYTHADSLKGTYGPARAWWDVLHYDLHVRFNLDDSTVGGYNTITYKVLQAGRNLQIDLMEPLVLDSVVQRGRPCSFRKDGHAYFVTVGPAQPGENAVLTAWYHGKPVQARNAPWDGGVVWSRDGKENPFISIACQGMAARVWFPNKDHMADEPDSATMHYTVPKDLFVVSNGRLQGVTQDDRTATFTWKVVNPINNYNIIPYIGKYVVVKDTLTGKGGGLDLEFWVTQENFHNAGSLFPQIKSMLRCFEHWFGKYPFYADGYKLVQSPYLGMEHQSAIAYGNGFANGYKGRDLSNTGWGLKWDFIIVHESGHEWFGNNISAADVADNWIHEGFTAYSECLFTEWLYGYDAGSEYVRGTRAMVQNNKPIIADYNVNAGGSIDLYYKAANMLHMIRRLVNDDERWLRTLRGLNSEFWHRTVTTREVEDYLSRSLALDLQPVFDQYLRTILIPVLEYRRKKGKVFYRYGNCLEAFRMPVELVNGQTRLTLRPSRKWKKLRWNGPTFSLAPEYYVQVKEVN